MRDIDGKFEAALAGEGLIRKIVLRNKVSHEEIPVDEPLFLLRARDSLAIFVLGAYASYAQRANCNDPHLAGIEQVMQKFRQFADDHPERMKQPGITRHLKLGI